VKSSALPAAARVEAPSWMEAYSSSAVGEGIDRAL
jgi:hypothetical protein